MREIIIVIDAEKDVVRLTFELSDIQPIYVEAVDKKLLTVSCFYTFSCNNIDIAADIDNFKKDSGVAAVKELLDLLEQLGYI